jgi:hypothetical protein
MSAPEDRDHLDPKTKSAKPIISKSSMDASRLVGIVAVMVVALAVLYIVYDWHKSKQRCFDCSDGTRCTIDIRQFATEYSAYAIELEASVKDQTKLSAKITPYQLEKLTEATENANELRKYLVSGFNSCAVTKAQYTEVEARFQTMDNLAREINALTGKATLTENDQASLASLIDQYGSLATHHPETPENK